jgi:acyl-CoA synthetase (AMP-forming)/AMP-acid ligase II
MRVPLTVADFLDRAATVYPDRIGAVDEPDAPGGGLGALTYGRIAQLARAQAAALDERGLGRGDRVAIVSQNASRLLVSFFGVSGYGRVLVPVNFRLNAEEIAYIVEHSGASLLLVDPELDEPLRDVACKERLVLGTDTDAELFLEGVDPTPWEEPDEDATGTINYTSGTTARPKGVQLTHRALWVNATTFGWQTGVSDRDVYLHTLPMFHCNGWGMPYALAGMGAKQVVLRKVDGTEILRRRVVVAGAPPPTRTIERVETELGWEFLQIYGLTETSPLLTMNRSRAEWDELSPAERAVKLSRAGAPALGVRLSTSDEGEVYARSNVVLEGYWDNPEASAEALAGGWFHTGDGGDIDGGYLTISDRKKDVIISGGENVSSIEVEDALFSHPAVAEVAVIGVPDEKWGEAVKALVVLAPGASATEDELIAHCRSKLAHYKCPRSVEFRDVLDRTATGKLQKFKLRAPFWEGRTRQVN